MTEQTSSDEVPRLTEFKASHPPAIKVGGMRVGAGRIRKTSQGDEKNKSNNVEEPIGDFINDFSKISSNEDNQQNPETIDDEQESGITSKRIAGQMVSGTFVPIQKAYPTEAVKQIHDKPGSHSKRDFHNHGKHDDQRFINQPRKQ